MKANHDQEEGCLFISMTEEDASMCFDAIEAMLQLMMSSCLLSVTTH